MGNVESIPPLSDHDLARSHPINKNDPTMSRTIEPDSGPLVLFIPKDVNFYKRFDIVQPSGTSYHGITFSSQLRRCVFALFDDTGQLLAACHAMRSIVPRYKICTPRPVFVGQNPSKKRYKGGQLYTYAEVTRCEVTMTSVVLSRFFSAWSGIEQGYQTRWCDCSHN
jgi:hypothetical protein